MFDLSSSGFRMLILEELDEKSKQTVFSSSLNISEITMVAIWRLRLGALKSRDPHFTQVDSSGLQGKVTGNKA